MSDDTTMVIWVMKILYSSSVYSWHLFLIQITWWQNWTRLSAHTHTHTHVLSCISLNTTGIALVFSGCSVVSCPTSLSLNFGTIVSPATESGDHSCMFFMSAALCQSVPLCSSCSASIKSHIHSDALSYLSREMHV